MKKYTIKTWLIGVIVGMLITNIPPIKTLFSLFIDENHYKYSNNNGSVTFCEIPFKQRLYNLNPFVPAKYRQLNPNSQDTVMYRLFKKNPIAFWRWAEYFYDKRYKLPYKSWKEIRKRRGYDLEYSNNWQDF